MIGCSRSPSRDRVNVVTINKLRSELVPIVSIRAKCRQKYHRAPRSAVIQNLQLYSRLNSDKLHGVGREIRGPWRALSQDTLAQKECQAQRQILESLQAIVLQVVCRLNQYPLCGICISLTEDAEWAG
jgi:hypothetical protein